MQREIVGYRVDETGDWVVELSCGHRRHARHRPPFESRPWILAPEGRRRRIGTPLECRLCDQDAAEGGEAACFANMLCPECGAVLDGGAHRDGCGFAAGKGVR
jgi:Protein of unknown function (DUF3565)